MFHSVIVPAFVFGMIHGGDNAPPWLVMLFLLPLVGVGVGVLLVAFNWGRRRTAIVTAHDRLLIVSESIFGQKRREWSKAEIAEICRGASGMEVNKVPVNELPVQPRSGKKFGCLAERSDDELGWIA